MLTKVMCTAQSFATAHLLCLTEGKMDKKKITLSLKDHLFTQHSHMFRLFFSVSQLHNYQKLEKQYYFWEALFTLNILFVFFKMAAEY